MAFCVWLLSLSVTFSRFISVVARYQYLILFNGWTIFYSMNKLYFIHSSADGHLGCSHLLATVSSTAMNQTSLLNSAPNMLTTLGNPLSPWAPEASSIKSGGKVLLEA